MILDLHRQGLSISEIARQSGLDRKTVRRYIERGLEPPTYGPRKPRPRLLDPFAGYLRERVATGALYRGDRLLTRRATRPRSAFRGALRDPARGAGSGRLGPIPRRLHRRAGDAADHLAVLNGARLQPADLGFVVHQDLATVLRCHAAAFEALGGAPREILYDRMKTAVLGEGNHEGIVYNRALIDLARHYGFYPKACRPYRAKTKGKVERPFRYIREDFFLARSFRNL